MTDVQKMLAGMIRPLEWDVDSRKVRLDLTMDFSEGYNWDGWELRQEAHGFGALYAIWRENFSDKYSLYCTVDGLYIQGGMTETEAKAAAQADYTARILAAINPDAVLALAAAAYADAVGIADAESEAAWALYKGRGPECADPHYQGVSDGQEQVARKIEARTPTDATAALARMLADARAEGLEMAMTEIKDYIRNRPLKPAPGWDDDYVIAWNEGGTDHMAAILAAIRAMKGEGA